MLARRNCKSQQAAGQDKREARLFAAFQSPYGDMQRVGSSGSALRTSSASAKSRLELGFVQQMADSGRPG